MADREIAQLARLVIAEGRAERVEQPFDLARQGRLPVRADVAPVPADAITKLGGGKVMPLDFTPEDEKHWQKRYQDFLRGR